MGRTAQLVSLFATLGLAGGSLAACGGGGSGGGGAPAAPTALTITPGDDYMIVSWEAVPSAAAYSLYAGTTADIDDHNYGYLPDGLHVPSMVKTSVRLEGLRPGDTYYVRVAAERGDATSPLSAVVGATLIPAAPSAVSVVPGIASLRIVWDSVLGAAAYDVYVSTDGKLTSANWSSLPTGRAFPGAAAPLDVSSLVNGVEYTVVVVARNASGSSDDSRSGKAAPSGRGTFSTFGSLNAGAAPESNATADVTGDGIPDLVVCCTGDGKACLFRGLGGGLFADREPLPVGNDPSAVAVADINGDGRPDILTTDRADGTVSLLLANGTGGFLPRSTYLAGLAPSALVVTRVDGDLILDLLVTDAAGDRLLFLRGLGGSFAAAVPTPVGAKPVGLVAGDWNGDGFIDVATANESSGDVTTLLGNGAGGFGSGADIPVGKTPAAIVARARLGTGILDLLVTASGDGDVVMLRGLGDGSFVLDSKVGVGSTPESIVSGDFDGDGRLDLAVADPTTGHISILLGDGINGFLPFFEMDVPAGPVDLGLIDMNGDGVLDLVATSANDGLVRLFVGSDV